MELTRVRSGWLVGGCLALLALVSAGCGDSVDYTVEGAVPVTGTITLDEKPLANASIRFVPPAEGQNQAGVMSASGKTDATGKYELVTGEQDTKGAKPGKYRVVISQYLKDGQPFTPDGEKSPMDLMIEGAKESLHANYSDVAFSKLEAVVPEGGGTIDFALKSDGALPK